MGPNPSPLYLELAGMGELGLELSVGKFGCFQFTLKTLQFFLQPAVVHHFVPQPMLIGSSSPPPALKPFSSVVGCGVLCSLFVPSVISTTGNGNILNQLYTFF